jgi:hypothetical protein
MVNLHYENIEIDYPREYFMRDVKRTVNDYYSYLYLVSEWMWKPERLDKVSWKISSSSRTIKKPRKASDQKLDPKHTWVTIESTDEEEFVDVVGSFCDASYVLEAPDRNSRWIRIIGADPNRGRLKLEEQPDPENECLYLPPNEYVINQQKRTLRKIRDNPEPEHRNLLRLFEESWRTNWERVKPVQIKNWAFLKDHGLEGTEEQREFVEIALGTPDFAILEGPPGSGKTTTICEIIIQEIQRGHRVLLCASTHVAVDNVLETLEEHGDTSKQVLAVRIGLERRISESVVDFQLQNREKKERKDLIKKLLNQPDRTDSQQYLLDALQSSDKENIITRVILDSANLVCGTTIGILQHPDIKAIRENGKNAKGEPFVAPFDCLILDEASKTTFQEFLVPALYCRKWILVGDIRQLSPYVETTHVEDNILNLIQSEEDAQVCLDNFLSWNGSRRNTQGILVINPKEPDKYCAQAEKLGLNFLDLTKNNSSYSYWDILSAQVILVNEESLLEIEALLPPDFTVSPQEAMTSLMHRRYEYWLKNNASQIIDGTKEASIVWAQNLGWRISRSFELRDNPEGSEHYDSAIKALLPQWGSVDEQDHLERDIETIKRIALPSALELLQKGFGRGNKYRRGSSITDGIDAQIFSERHIKLSYQHRMHPEISRFPREYIYDSNSLKDLEMIAEKREWGYKRYDYRAGWIQTIGVHKDSNSNKLEADIVIEELASFLEWAKKNPNKNGEAPWKVAVLTFYRDQESYLRKRIQKMLGTRLRTEFKVKDGSTIIRLCTVDRFQGHEADLVILSFVRNNRIGFLDSSTRLNVAITRARYQLLLVGNRRRFARQKRDNRLKDLAENVPVLGSVWAGRNRK